MQLTTEIVFSQPVKPEEVTFGSLSFVYDGRSYLLDLGNGSYSTSLQHPEIVAVCVDDKNGVNSLQVKKVGSKKNEFTSRLSIQIDKDAVRRGSAPRRVLSMVISEDGKFTIIPLNVLNDIEIEYELR